MPEWQGRFLYNFFRIGFSHLVNYRKLDWLGSIALGEKKHVLPEVDVVSRILIFKAFLHFIVSVSW